MTRGGGGISQFLIYSNMGGGRVGKFLNIDRKGGRGGLDPSFFADIICEQTLIGSLLQGVNNCRKIYKQIRKSMPVVLFTFLEACTAKPRR